MVRPKTDLNFLEIIPIIKDFLEDNTVLDKSKVRRYLLDLAKIYPFIIRECRTFDSFLELDRNKKSKFFVEFVNRQVDDLVKRDPSRSRDLIKNRQLQIVWRVQGFLGYLSTERDLRGNPKWIEDINPIPNFIRKINIVDVYDLYEILPDKGRRRLKLQFYAGWNNVDLTQLRLDDFKPTFSNEYFYVAKTRQKTWKKKVVYLNLFGDDFQFELERYCNRYDIKDNDLIFPVGSNAISEYYRSHLQQNKYINQNVTPKYVRQLCFTQLEPVFKQDPDLFDLWTQHKMGVLKTNYIKNYIERLIPLHELIKERVCLGSIKRMKVEIQELKKDIHTELLLQQTRLEKVEQNLKESNEGKFDDIANKIIKAVSDKLGRNLE